MLVVRVYRSTLDHVQLRRDRATAAMKVMTVHVVLTTKHFAVAYLYAVGGVNARQSTTYIVMHFFRNRRASRSAAANERLSRRVERSDT